MHWLQMSHSGLPHNVMHFTSSNIRIASINKQVAWILSWLMLATVEPEEVEKDNNIAVCIVQVYFLSYSVGCHRSSALFNCRQLYSSQEMPTKFLTHLAYTRGNVVSTVISVIVVFPLSSPLWLALTTCEVEASCASWHSMVEATGWCWNYRAHN